MKRFLCFAVLAALAPGLLATPEYPNKGPDIYDTQADGATLISDAVRKANVENKRVLLDFGANWCPWCHKLHQLMAEDPVVSKELTANFVLVMIDVNHRDGKSRNDGVNKYYENPTKEGLPVLVVLSRTGKQLVTQETGALEEGDHHSPQKVLAFLQKWKPSMASK